MVSATRKIIDGWTNSSQLPITNIWQLTAIMTITNIFRIEVWKGALLLIRENTSSLRRKNRNSLIDNMSRLFRLTRTPNKDSKIIVYMNELPKRIT